MAPTGTSWEVLLDVWKPIGEAEATFLEQLWSGHGAREGRFTSRGQVYAFDLGNMTQTNVSSGKVRQIRRVGVETNEDTNAVEEKPVPRAILQESKSTLEDTNLVVEVWLAGEWKRLTQAESRDIIKQKEEGSSVFHITTRGTSYRIDLRHMTQTNLASNRTRTIRIVDRLATHIDETADVGFDTFRDAFRMRAPDGRDQRLTTEVLLKTWPVTAKIDADLLRYSIDGLVKEMNLRRNDHVDMTEWNHYWALDRDRPSFHAAREVNEQLSNALKKDPQVLGRMQMHFETAATESSSSGAHVGLTKDGLLRACERLVTSPQDVVEKQWAREVLQKHSGGSGADVLEDDEELRYYDFLNVMLGRKRYKVYLWMYDISDGFAERWSWLLLGQSFKGIWHTGIVVEWPEKCSEFWFGGSLFESVPGTTPFGQPIEKRFLGYTYKRREEVWDFVARHCAAEFTRENYDVLTHNCNHFSEKLSIFLRNEHIPDEVIKQPEMVMETITARVLRPILNRWLGGFDAKDGRATDGGEAARLRWQSVLPGALIEFASDSGRPLYGIVKDMFADRCSVETIDFWQSALVERLVSKENVSKVLKAGCSIGRIDRSAVTIQPEGRPWWHFPC